MLPKLRVIATLILVVSIIMGAPADAASVSPIAKEGCRSRCGSVDIRYPFGMGSPDCFYNKWFEILCINDRTHLYLNQDVGELLRIGGAHDVVDDEGRVTGVEYDPDGHTELEFRSNTSNMLVCEDTSKLVGPNLTGTPFYYSTYNKFMLVGTGIATIFGANELERGCSSVSDGGRPWSEFKPCNGLNCCQTDVGGSNNVSTEMSVDYLSLNAVTGKNSCASAFLVNADWKPKNISLFSDPSADLTGISVPVLLEWKIPKSMPGHGFQNNKYCEGNILGLETWYCTCPCGFSGNPYITDGCQDRTSCYTSRFSPNFLVIGVTCFSTLVVIVICGTTITTIRITRRRRTEKLKYKIFKQNGGVLLQKYLSSSHNIMGKVRLYTGKDMNKATDQFNDNRVLGRGGQGTVYKGMLADGKIVAIKKAKLLVNANQVEEFINEIIILSHLDHRNVVKLFGCCLDMDVPLLVYEYIPNGTLYNLIHNENTDFPLTWEVRLRISLEIAEALTYLHSATSIPIYHRDIKSSNILLDEKYKAKVADFGISRHIGVDQTHLTTLVKGTFGYLDPEYFQSSQFTEKSDVYSFGVVLVELLTGLKPIYFSEEEESHLNLATRFMLAIQENCVHIILDPQVIKTSTEEEREAIIRLSQRCLNMNGRNRPSMKEIVMELQSIKRSEICSTVLENSYGKVDRKNKEVELSDVSMSSHSTTSSSDDFPFMSSSF